MGGFLGAVDAGRAALELSARLPPCRDDHRPSASRWSATPRTASTRSPARASISASATPPRSPQVLVEGARLGLDLGDAQLLARYERWRSLDTFIGRARHRQPDPPLRRPRPRRLGGPPLRHGRWSQRIGPLKDRLMAEARGEAANCRCCCAG